MVRLASVFVVAAAVALADDQPPAEKTAPPAEEGIAAAKRDFQRVKAARGAAVGEQSGLDLPHLTTPELQLNNGASPVMQALPLKPGAKKKSANWLVDEMMKKPQADSRDKTRNERETSPDRGAMSDEDKKLDEASGETDREKTTDGQPEKSADPGVNPLNQYMAGWMTPKDYALLRPGLSGDVAADTAGRTDPSLPAPGSGGAVTGPTGDNSLALSLSGMAAPAAALPAPRDNPFLQTFTPPSQPAAAFVPPTGPAPTMSPPGIFTAPPEPPPTRSKLPEIAKPSDDAKYFKQLKRF